MHAYRPPRLLPLLLPLLLVSADAAAAEREIPPCAEEPGFHALDFRVGSWSV